MSDTENKKKSAAMQSAKKRGSTSKNTATNSSSTVSGRKKSSVKSTKYNKQGKALNGTEKRRSKAGQSALDTKNRNGKATRNPKKPLKIIPLGGLGEIGKNITLYEYDGDMLLVDCGMSFPDEETPGIDIVIPDFTFILENKDKIKGMVVTHGHEDHIGAIPYLLRNFNVPIYATRLTVGLIECKLKEHRLLEGSHLNVVNPSQTVSLGKFSVEFIHVNHSIPDAVGFAITCGAGTVVQTGDFKIDTTPIDDQVIDIGRFAELGKRGVLALLSDSTNAERQGFTPSERIVGDSFSNLFAKAGSHRIIVATFSSNIHRIQQIIDEAVKLGRKIAVSGRSMINVVTVGSELGYLKIPDGVLIDVGDIKKYKEEQIVVITTGSQGEPLSALHRIAFGDHKQIEVVSGDMFIISANPIPGNEKLVDKVVNELIKRGANVVYEKMYDVHVSGHACSEELKLMMSIIKPKFFIPVHGEQKHLYKHSLLAYTMGIPRENVLVANNGNVIELTNAEIKCTDTVQAGRVLVDGLGVGDVGSIVLRDRKHLAEDGIIIVTVAVDGITREVVSGPEVLSRGFVFVKESEELMTELNETVCNILENCYISRIRDWNTVKTRIKDGVFRFLYSRTHRSPMVLPVIMEV